MVIRVPVPPICVLVSKIFTISGRAGILEIYPTEFVLPDVPLIAYIALNIIKRFWPGKPDFQEIPICI